MHQYLQIRRCNYLIIQINLDLCIEMNARTLLWLCLAGVAFWGWQHFHKNIQKTRDDPAPQYCTPG